MQLRRRSLGYTQLSDQVRFECHICGVCLLVAVRWWVTNDLKYCGIDSEIERLLLRDGDLLFNRTNSPELVGKSAVYHGDSPMSFASYLIRIRFDTEIAHPDFANYWLNSAWGREWARLSPRRTA